MASQSPCGLGPAPVREGARRRLSLTSSKLTKGVARPGAVLTPSRATQLPSIPPKALGSSYISVASWSIFIAVLVVIVAPVFKV